MKSNSSTVPIILTILLIIALCCLAIGLLIFAGGAAFLSRQETPQPITETINQATATPAAALPTPMSDLATPTDEQPEPEQTPTPAEPGRNQTLITLHEEIVPVNDPIDLGERLGGKNNIPETLPDPNTPYEVGETQDFWVTNVDSNENFRISTTLRYRGEHVYIWIEDDVAYARGDLVSLGDTFDQEIYPTNREFFGSEWTPGVDRDPRIYIVYAGGLGNSLAGYYSSADQLHPEAHEFSNGHEMFLINSDNVYLWEDYIYGTLAHEYQHMIHWYTDKNEETWLNEGFSMLAELINNFDPGGFDHAFIGNPDLQLTDWGGEVGNNGPHYGAAMLFTTYFLDRFGDEATKAVVAHPENGMESIDIVLQELDLRDPATNQVITAEDVFADWTIANYLGSSSVADGRYHYSNYPAAPTAVAGSSLPVCPIGPENYDVAQFGADYIEITCSGDYTLDFIGDRFDTILPVNPYSGETYMWSNMGDHSNMSLEQTFDLSDADGPVEMVYQTWYDLEKDYDYVFVSASTNGDDWSILNSTSCTTQNPSGNSYGCGLNGETNGWQEEVVDLSAFTGQQVTLRFDYVTDAAVNGDGMVIDDIQIEAIDYFSDFESDDGGWQAEGFVRIQNILPQSFRLSMIALGDEINIIPITLDENNRASVNFTIGEEIDSVVLVVSGTTPYTRQKAKYQINIE